VTDKQTLQSLSVSLGSCSAFGGDEFAILFDAPLDIADATRRGATYRVHARINWKPRKVGMPPRLGEDSFEVSLEVGLREADIQTFVGSKAIGLTP
jgi:hypothetical protein